MIMTQLPFQKTGSETFQWSPFFSVILILPVFLLIQSYFIFHF